MPPSSIDVLTAAPRRGRPRKAIDEEHILRAAARVIAEAPSSGAPVERVCDELGVSKPYLYERFGPKEELVQRVFEWATGRLIAFLDQTYASYDQSETGERLGAALLAPALFHRKEPVLYDLLLRSQAHADLRQAALRQVRDHVEAEVYRLLSRHAAVGKNRQADLRILAAAIVGMGERVSHLISDDAGVTLEQASRLIRTFVLAGIGDWLARRVGPRPG